MLVIPEKQQLILDSSQNDFVAQCIPHSKKFMHDGKELLAVKYGVEESIVLKNMGFSIPEPIRHYYTWPARFQPMEHQIATAAFLTTHKKALCNNRS